MASRREIYTIWMQSLVFHGNGCTVYDSKGEIVYRIDNYGNKCCHKVYLMDLHGEVLFSILQKKKLGIFGYWVGYKWSGCKVKKESRPCLKVRKDWRILRRDMSCDVRLGCDEAKASCSYRIVGLAGKSTFKIMDTNNQLVAEVKQKESTSGVLLGDDVLTLVVEPQRDHSLVMALMTVYGLINQKM
ncbi:protein LURP-one-related 4-like [Cornus florida]|uniref:protein LURP-one-related 4-like n=1 Tax=Cornus florida TaxID=4283 RepID=UPI00289E77BE|nr:protein LURP-one-related 4-like [Cornus florida]